MGIVPGQQDEDESAKSPIDRLDEALSGDTLYAAHPELERAPISAKDRKDYEGIALVMFLVVALLVWVFLLYSPNPLLGFVLAAPFLAFLVPFGLALRSLKKAYLGIGLAAFGALFTFVGIMAIMRDVFRTGPWGAIVGEEGGSAWDALFFFGVPALFIARRVFRRKTPIYGLR